MVARVLNFYKEFLTPGEKRAYRTLLFIRCISGILDLVGVLSIGYLATSIASFLGDGSNVGKTIEVAGRSLPAVTAASLPTLSGAIAGLFIAKAIISISITKFMAIRVARIEARAAQSIAKVILGGSLSDFKSVKKEELRFSIQVGTTAAFTIVLNAFASLVSEGFLFILLCAAFLVFNPLATLAMLAYFGLLILLMNFFVGKRQSLAARENYLHVVQANNALGDLISAFRELAVLQKRDLFFNEIYRSREAASKSVGQQAYLAGMPRHIIESGLVIGLGLFIWAQSGTTDLSASAATTGVFLAGGFRIVAALLPWQNALSSIRASLPQAQSTYEFLHKTIPESQTITETKTGNRKSIKVEFQNVSYSYDNGNSPALEKINLVISPGQTVAFIGPSGAGKSTLADLIMGLETPTSGSILINGENSNRALSSSSGIAGYVPQVPGMVSGTLAENIAIGEAREDISQINLQSAIKESHLEGLIQKLGIQLDSDIGEHGDRLSGGQKQRIGIARALYSRPGLLVLDEATSALDAESENEIIKTLRELRGKVTIITIAHRLNSIRDVDVVYVLDSGKIVDSGTLGELELSNPMVAKALSLLSSGEEVEKK